MRHGIHEPPKVIPTDALIGTQSVQDLRRVGRSKTKWSLAWWGFVEINRYLLRSRFLLEVQRSVRNPNGTPALYLRRTGKRKQFLKRTTGRKKLLFMDTARAVRLPNKAYLIDDLIDALSQRRTYRAWRHTWSHCPRRDLITIQDEECIALRVPEYQELIAAMCSVLSVPKERALS